MYECTNCDYKGETLSVRGPQKIDGKCPVCGDNVIKVGSIEKPKPKINLDLNGDGKVDKKDTSIASKVMNYARKKKKAKRSKR